MTVAIERFSAPDFASRIAYRIVMLESEDFSLYPGTVIGYLAPSADSSKFELWLYSERRGSMLYSPTRLIATLSGSMLTFSRTMVMKLKVRVSFARFLPSRFRGICFGRDVSGGGCAGGVYVERAEIVVEHKRPCIDRSCFTALARLGDGSHRTLLQQSHHTSVDHSVFNQCL